MSVLPWPHVCVSCGWYGWHPPEIDRGGRHLTREGGMCAGAINTFPPPPIALATEQTRRTEPDGDGADA